MNDKLLLGLALGFLLGSSKSTKHPPAPIVPVGKTTPTIRKRPTPYVKPAPRPRPRIIIR